MGAGRGAPPGGGLRRGAVAPSVPLHLLDSPGAGERLRAAFAARSAAVGARTANRELSALVSAVTWWRARGWLRGGDPVAGLRPLPPPGRRTTALAPGEAAAVLALRAPLREQALWHVLYESGGTVEAVLALDVDDLDLPGRRTRVRHEPALRWREGAAGLLPLLALGRVDGPLFASGRGRRLSYRRAAEVFSAATRGLDPSGRGFTLHRLSAAGRTRPTTR
ncbi:hypothetical protein [Actinacidiphila yeochonensis]|uniref:hypothetical protein n=1 Tax=Actinacidiphila yeochonensis TaxID=89050 RepID=UPI0018E3385A|nr:hypothetical protein [Actinacidiphila yeochonensis]